MLAKFIWNQFLLKISLFIKKKINSIKNLEYIDKYDYYTIYEGVDMAKMRIYYYTTIQTEKSEEDIFDEFPDEFTYEAKRGKLRMVKDTIEMVSDEIEYGEG